MGRKRVEIPKKTLKELYINQNLSPTKIGLKFGCNWATVLTRLREYKIKLKSPAQARMKYAKKDFSGDLCTKSYMVGFRVGDLNVYRPGKKSETIIARCHTTQKVQVDLIRSLFSEFGQCNVSSSKGHFYINCYLNESFDFLISKRQDAWRDLKNKQDLMCALVAGYSDAEGNFLINQGRARFKIDSYDFDILKDISVWLHKNRISNRFRLIYKEGEGMSGHPKFKKDLWRLNVNEALSLRKFIRVISPYLRHRTRIRQTKICLKNIEARLKNGTI